MSVKDFKAGMAAGAKPFGDKLDQLATANESGLNDITEGVDGIRAVVDTLLDDLSVQEKKKLYDLDEAMDLSVLEDDEQEFLVAVLATLANAIPDVSDLQKKYLLSICNVTNIASPQTTLNLACIENIENMKTQKILLRYVMEFLFIGEQGYDFLDTYEDAVFCYFSVNKRGVAEIKDMINRIFNAMGVEGIANRYAFEPVAEETVIAHDQPIAFIENGVDLRARAETAYLKYEIAEAMPFFNLMSEQGDSRSKYFLGNIYRFGYKGIVVPDIDKAREYWEQGKTEGDCLCSLRYAGELVDSPEKQTIYASILEQAIGLAQSGDVFAMFELARVYHFAYEAMADMEQAIHWYSLASGAGLWCAANNLANLLSEQGKQEEAISLYEKAAACDYESAIYNLGLQYQQGAGVDMSEAEAISLFERAAALGFSKSMYALGDMAEQKRAYDEAAEWYSKAFKRNDISCYYEYARATYRKMYETYVDEIDGEEIKSTNLDHALLWLFVAAVWDEDDGVVELAGQIAHNRLTERILNIGRKVFNIEFDGMLIDNTEFTDSKNFMQDLQKWANEYLQNQADAGSVVAQYYLGMKYATAYQSGKSPADKESAKRWLGAAIEHFAKQIHEGESVPPLAHHILEVYEKLDKRLVVSWPKTRFFAEAD